TAAALDTESDAGVSAHGDGGMHGCHGGPGGHHGGRGGPGGGPGGQEGAAAGSGKAAGGACTRTPDNRSIGGVCRAHSGGTTLRCHPNPPAALVAACAGLTEGTACTATAPDGDTHSGTCRADRDDASTLICLPDRPGEPPPGN